jgi:hypothetical protein
MSTDYKIVPFEEKYFDGLVDLLSLTFSMKSKDKASVIRWKFFDKVHKKRTVTYLALSDNTVVGHYSNIPLDVSYGNKAIKATACIDMATHPDHRGKGLISQMSHEVYRHIEKQFDVSIGFSNENGVKVDRSSKNYGYFIVGAFVSFAKIVIHKKQTPYTLSKVHSFNKTVSESNDEKLFMLAKTQEYLKWKHIDNPYYSKTIYEIKENEHFVGYAMVKESKNRWYVQDVILPQYNEQIISNVLKAIQNEAFEKGIRLVLVYVLDNSLWRNLLLKNKYAPAVLKRKKFYLTIKFHNKLNEQALMVDKDNWFVMGGDII